jgi:hypothetical protein
MRIPSSTVMPSPSLKQPDEAKPAPAPAAPAQAPASKGWAPGAKAQPAAQPAAPPRTLTIDLPGVGLKTYNFPTKFHDVELLSAQVELPTSAVKQWLPPGMEPVSTLGLTRGLVTFQHLGKPEQMQPYDEAQFAVKVKGPDGKEGWHVLDMPVTSFENKQRGQYIFGYPKEMSKVGIENSGLGRKGTAAAEDGTPLFSLSVGPRLPVGVHHAQQNEAYQTLNGQNVKLHSSASGKVAPGLGNVQFSQAMRNRFPGLPEKPFVVLAGRLTDGELSLDLPEKL